jgi:hypothetical protein
MQEEKRKRNKKKGKEKKKMTTYDPYIDIIFQQCNHLLGI